MFYIFQAVTQTIGHFGHEGRCQHTTIHLPFFDCLKAFHQPNSGPRLKPAATPPAHWSRSQDALSEKRQVALVEAGMLDVFLKWRKQEVLGDEGGELLQVELRHMLGEAHETLSPSSSNVRIAR